MLVVWVCVCAVWCNSTRDAIVLSHPIYHVHAAVRRHSTWDYSSSATAEFLFSHARRQINKNNNFRLSLSLSPARILQLPSSASISLSLNGWMCVHKQFVRWDHNKSKQNPFESITPKHIVWLFYLFISFVRQGNTFRSVADDPVQLFMSATDSGRGQGDRLRDAAEINLWTN